MTAFRGTRAAAGFVLDVGLIGEDEARRRVIAAWAGGARLRALPDGRWLLLLAMPVTVRAERAPGLCVTESHGAYAAAAPAAEPGTIAVLHGGAVEVLRLADLPVIDPSAWIRGPSRVATLEALDRPPEPTPVAPREKVEAPDLREAAGVGAPSERAAKSARELVEQARGGRAPGGARGGDLLARLLLRSPARGAIGRRHRRYLEQLTRSFERREYDRALRDAIALGGAAGRLALRLPAPRRGRLGPTPRRAAGGGSVPWGEDVHHHLSTLYRQAAEQLERDGDVEGAAFVYADLLDSPRDAVALLERHRRYGLAARLAEGRELEPALVVRLWWLAGDRRRAIDVARARGAWAAAIERLEGSLPREAAALRAEWVAAARRAGDHRLAVEAAWPDPELRAQLGDDLAALRERGGRVGARALVRQLALRADDALRAEAATLLAGREPATVAVRSAFADELAAIPAADPAADRELATGALRALLREHGPKDARTRLRPRVDPLLRADLPPVPPAPADHVPLIVADAEPGAVALHDAVVLDRGLLVATGAHGLQLLTLDGRPRGRWDIAADALCVADHGDRVLAIGRGESTAELHGFDLATRRARRRGVLRRAFVLDSYDGATVTVLDPDGMADIDVTGDEPRELWRELDRDTVVLEVARSPRSMAAIVDTPLQGGGGERSIELWVWELPSRRLVRRELADGRWDREAVTTATGTLLWLAGEEEVRRTNGRAATARAPEGARHVVSGEVDGLVDPEGPRVTLRRDGRPAAVVELPGAETVRVRAHADVACVWAPDGRVVAVDLATRAAVANLTVRVSA